MKRDASLYNRRVKHPRHRLTARDYTGRRAYFLTLCTAERQDYFSSPELVHPLIEVMLERFEKAGFSVYAYCFMPDHCHVLIVAMSDSCQLANAVRGFKGAAVALARKFGIHELWQRNFYEHILRSSEDLGAVAAYILQNPVRARLVHDSRDWPFLGTLMFGWEKHRLKEQATPDWKSKNAAG
jgi:putative transposase